MDAYKFRVKGSAYADRMTAGYSHTTFECSEHGNTCYDDEEPRCAVCGERGEAIMHTRYGRWPARDGAPDSGDMQPDEDTGPTRSPR